MKQNFNDCLTRLLKFEGGYTNDAEDPGGPTNFGITIFDYRKYIDPKGTADDVRKMTVDQAKTIYKEKYWDALDCDNLPSGVDFTVFDYGVNSGLGRPRNDLRRFQNLSGTQLINAINDERMAFLRGLNTFPRFGKGWTARVASVRQHSIELASQANHSAAPIAATVTTAAAATAAHTSYFSHIHWGYVIGGGVILAVVVAYLIHKLFNKGK